jgi:hypothetical protein
MNAKTPRKPRLEEEQMRVRDTGVSAVLAVFAGGTPVSHRAISLFLP